MKLSDYVVKFLIEQKVKYVFGITGGAIVHVFDSIGKCKEIEYVCPQHEQAAAMAADAYSRITGNLGVAIATSGPGATNLVTGVACAHFDSVPTLFITGQVATFRLKKDSGVRQLGFQEVDTASMFKPITKYAVLVEDPKNIRYELEKAVYLAKSGRPGSVLVDLPDDVQRADIEPDKLDGFVPLKEKVDYEKLGKQVEKCISLINEAKRPVIILGAGVKLGNANEKAKKFVEKLRFPVVLTWATLDLFPHNHPLNVGGFGVTSTRYGNFTVQNSDLIISIGARLDTHETGSPPSTFVREAKKIILDIDKTELDKFKKYRMEIHVPINANVIDFFNIFEKKMYKVKPHDISDWIDRIQKWKKKYPICPTEYFDEKDCVNSYVFMDALSEESSEGDIIIADTGGNLAQTMQGYKVKKGQTLFAAFNNAPMGYSLPASIGACFADNKRKVICITGDGGIQINIQELATITKHKLPIKIFVINNMGYGMIQQTQDDWLESRYEASNVDSGLAVPDFVKIAEAYGLKTEKIKNHSTLREKIRKVLACKEAVLCEVCISEKQRTVPMLKFGRPIEDAKPLLDRKEFLDNMIVKPFDPCLQK